MSDLPAGPIWLTVVDLDRPDPQLTAPAAAPDRTPYATAQVLVRLHGRPLGQVRVPLQHGHIPAAPLDADLPADLRAAREEHLRRDADAGPCRWQDRLAATGAGTPLASVVLATCGRPERLTRTLQTLVTQTYPELEVLVVDNRPGGPETARAVAAVGDPRVRLLDEPRPGASLARNAGVRAAAGEVVAVTDDDVDADPDWLGNLVTPFYEDPRTACVTGLILPANLDTPAEQLFEEYGGYAKGFTPDAFTAEDTHRGPLYPYTAGRFGSGACAAFRRTVLLELGGFPADLGPATAARGGEDLDVYLSVLHAGHRLRYEPAALVRHEHRQGDADLARQVYSYGVGLSAMITRRMVNSRTERRAILRALPAAVHYVLDADSAKNAAKTAAYPRRLSAYEWAGMAYGPVAYLRSRRRARSG